MRLHCRKGKQSKAKHSTAQPAQYRACSLVASVGAYKSLLPDVVAPEARSQLCAQRQHHYKTILHYGSLHGGCQNWEVSACTKRSVAACSGQNGNGKFHMSGLEQIVTYHSPSN